jgi:hypothetical protein
MNDDDFTTMYTTVIDPPPPPNQGRVWQVIAAILFFALLAILL